MRAACGEECSVDGVHSVDAVYDAALQVLLGMYRLEGGRPLAHGSTGA